MFVYKTLGMIAPAVDQKFQSILNNLVHGATAKCSADLVLAYPIGL